MVMQYLYVMLDLDRIEPAVAAMLGNNPFSTTAAHKLLQLQKKTMEELRETL